MRKKVIFILVLIFLILVVGGVFLWRLIPEEPEIKGSPEDYQVIEKEDGKWIENKKAGLKVKVPDGWIVEKIDVMEGSMIMYSPDAKGVRSVEEITLPLKKGCMIETAIKYEAMSIESIKNEVKKLHEQLLIRSEDFSNIEINNFPSLKNTFEAVELGHVSTVYVPLGDRLIVLSISASKEDREKCFQKFDNFLKTILIE